MEKYTYFLVNAFSDQELSGNPTPVFLLDHLIQKGEMANRAKQSNVAVSVFIFQDPKTKVYEINYFTPTGEIPACGHGTLAAAFVLFQKNKNINTVRFSTSDNSILEAYNENGITFVRYPIFLKKDITPNSEINRALGIEEFKAYFICKDLESLFIELENEMKVQAVKPDFDALIRSSETLKEVVVMSKSNEQFNDYFLRSFCPWIGINEDPVTGSVHSVLGPYWKDRIKKKNLTARQLSKRGGEIRVIVSTEHVSIGGKCKILVKNT